MSSNLSNADTVSNIERQDDLPSGQSSPEDARSLFSGRPRSSTNTTLVSGSTTVPPLSVRPPFNSPEGGSLVGDPVDPDTLLTRIETLKPFSPSASEAGTNSEMAQKGQAGGQQQLQHPEEPVKREGVAEISMWDGDALESAANGLKRLVQLAADQNERDPSKPIEQYYSEHLAKVIKEVGIEFDASLLQQGCLGY